VVGLSKKKIDLIKQELELYLSNPSLTMESKGWTKAQYDEIIEDLEQKIKNSKRGKSSKNKGANYERTIAKIFKEKLGVELKRTPQSGGFAKNSSKGDEFRGDIVSIDGTVDFILHVECKSHKTWKLKEWIRQSKEDCPEGKIPIVVFHQGQRNENGKRVEEAGDYVALSLEDFLDIVDKDKIVVRQLPTSISGGGLQKP